MKKNNRLRRDQLDRSFIHLKTLNLRTPKKGWLKEIRESLGMSMKDLAERLGTIKQRVERIEKDEVASKVTLETMKKTAEAMNCDFVYFILPKNSLEETLKDQSFKTAQKILKQVGQTMALEAQSTSNLSKKKMIENLAQEMLLKEDRKIWKEK
jgi:predicted DNA-binding mobile mystery protein A